MLRRLTVKNLAIVEDLEMEFEGGLTVITGETGAGKSILVDALSLLSGGRGSVDLVREGAARLTVSGEFDADAPIRRILSEAGLPDGSSLLLRREFSPDGKGRVFVEDEAASVRTLAKIGERLVAIHGQNSERDLADPETPLELLDEHAGAVEEVRAAAAAAQEWSSARRALEELEASRRDRDARLEMLDYQVREIREAAPDEKEEEELTVERDRLLHADRIRSAAEAALSALSEDEGSAADRLGEAGRAFTQLAAIDPRERARVDEVEDLKRRVADLAAMARDAAGSVEGDPDRLTGIESRLEKLARIKRKYGGTLAEVRALAEKLARERDELSDIEDSLERRRKEERSARAAYLEAARSLSGKRASSAPRFSAAVERELHALAMEKARFEVRLDRVSDDAPRSSGLETAAFLFAPNPGEAAKPVEKIASGGELSRLHLAIQSVAAGKKGARRTLVFDEVDSGIGGRAARGVGPELKTPPPPRPGPRGRGPPHPPLPGREARGARANDRRRPPGRRQGASRRDRANARRRNDPRDRRQARSDASRGGTGMSGRYSRSVLFPGIGQEGQRRIEAFSIAFVGVGAVGAAAAEAAARAGVGRLTIVDRDVVEESNLARQFLFDAEDAARVAPKAEAAASRLRAIAPGLDVRPVVADLDQANAAETLRGHDLVFDGSDNFETRLLVSDAARLLGISALYAACVGEEGLVAANVAGKTPCLRCFLEKLPPAGSGPTCDTAGIVPTLPLFVAAAGMTESLRIAAGLEPSRGVLSIRVWEGGIHSRRLFESVGPSAACPVCRGERFPALEEESVSKVVKLCGRNSVQVSPAGRERPDFAALESRLIRVGRVRRSPHLLAADVEDVSLTVFADGRCVVRGTDDPRRARALYEQYVGR